MNSKTRALLWEEIRVGGSIAAACTAVGMVVLVAPCLPWVFDTATRVLWRQVDSFNLMVALGVPLLTSMLLVLNAANSGHLTGGFSRRLMRLPVHTWSSVLIVLTTRLFESLAVSGIMSSVCWALFRHGPGIRTVFFLAGMYLLIQVLSWARNVVPLLALLAIPAAFGVLLGRLGSVETWKDAALSTDGLTSGFLIYGAVYLVAAYAVSFVLVSMARRGDRFLALSAPSLDAVLHRSSAIRRKAFAT